MNAFEQFDDLENHFAKVSAVVNHFEKSQQNQKNYAIVIEKLTEDVENLRESNKSLNQQLLSSSSYSEEESRIHTFYVNLKEKYNQLERSYFKIEKKNLFIEQNHTLNVIQLEEHFELEKERIHRENMEKIKFLEAKLSEEKKEKLNMETKLQNELQILQATSAVQIDDSESRGQLQLREANHKILELNYSANIIKDELLRLQTINSKKDNSIQELEDLRRRVKSLQYKLTVSEEKLQMYENGSHQLKKNYSDIQQFASTSFQERLYDSNIYESQVVESDNNHLSDIQQFASNSFQERLYEQNIHKSKVAESDNNNVSLLGKNKISMSLSKPNQSKKRRLFDPKRLDYLKDLEQTH